MRSYGPKVRAARDAADMTQLQLAVAAGVTPNTIIKLEQGRDVRISTLEAVASVLGTTPADLLA